MHHFDTYQSAHGQHFNIRCELIDRCPHCGERMTPHVVERRWDPTDPEIVVYLQRCPIKTCHEFFTSVYDVRKAERASADAILTGAKRYDTSRFEGVIRDYNYSPTLDAGVSDKLEKLSAEFAITYAHALNAKAKGLDNIVGVSLRKSLEFLVKDFAIYRNPEKADKIKQSSLNNVIQEYYKDLPALKVVLDTARKIGNDETHYYRKYTKVDVDDLLGLIEGFSSYIDLILNVEELENRMRD